MKILKLTSSFPRYEGDYFGPWVLEYCRELERQGHEVTIVAPNAGSKSLNHLSSQNLKIVRFNYWWPQSSQKLVYPPGIIPQLKKKLWRYIQIPFLLFFYFLTVRRLMKKEKFDVVHSQWVIPSGSIGSLLSKKFNLPHFITSQGAEFFLPRNHIFSKFTVNVLKRCDLLFPVSKQMATKALDFGIHPDQIKVIPNTVNTSTFNPSIKSKFREEHGIAQHELVILTIRRLVFEKRVEDVIQAVAKIDPKVKCKLIIAGDGPDRQSLESLVDQSGIRQKVIFLGFIDNNKLPPIYAASDMYILSSQQEGLSLSLLESMSSELVIISTSDTGGEELIKHGENGFLYPVGDIEALTAIIIQVLNLPPDRLMSIKQFARKKILAEYNVQHMVEQWVSYYKQYL